MQEEYSFVLSNLASGMVKCPEESKWEHQEDEKKQL